MPGESRRTHVATLVVDTRKPTGSTPVTQDQGQREALTDREVLFLN